MSTPTEGRSPEDYVKWYREVYGQENPDPSRYAAWAAETVNGN